MKKRIWFCIAGLLLCILFPIGTLVFGPEQPVGHEHLQQRPTIMHQPDGINDAFLAEAASFYDDHFFLRGRLLTVWMQLQAGMFHTSGSQKVLLGEDGWLFYTPTVADFSGTDPMTSREMYCAAENLSILQQSAQERGAEFLFLCVPNKSTVYPEKMPPFPAAQAHDFERLYKYLDQNGTRYVNLMDHFRGFREQMYFAHDSHWNSRGAAIAADAIAAHFGITADYRNGTFYESILHKGDLYGMLYPLAADPEWDWGYGDTLTFAYGEKSGTRPDSITIRTAGNGERSLLMYRDSFGDLLYPYLADCFEEAVFSRSADYDLTQCSADCVVIELVERNLRNLIRNIPKVCAPKAETVPAKNQGQMALTGEPDGVYIQWRGTIDNVDMNSQILLEAYGQFYRCFLLENGGFAAMLPVNSIPSAVQYQQDGCWVRMTVTQSGEK